MISLTEKFNSLRQVSPARAAHRTLALLFSAVSFAPAASLLSLALISVCIETEDGTAPPPLDSDKPLKSLLVPQNILATPFMKVRQFNELQDHIFQSGLVNGKVPVKSGTRLLKTQAAVSGDYATSQISVSLSEDFLIQLAQDPIGSLTGQESFSVAASYFHEYAHVEHWSGIQTPFAVPVFSGTVQMHLWNLIYGERPRDPRGWPAVKERFADIYGWYLLIRSIDPQYDHVLKRDLENWMDSRSFWSGKEFAHNLGPAMKLVNMMDFETVRALAPNQLKVLAVRQASMIYLAEVKANEIRYEDLTVMESSFDTVINKDPVSKASWDKMNVKDPAFINAVAMADLPAPVRCVLPVDRKPPVCP